MKTTEIINHFDLPSELKSVTGTFRYRYFEPLEKTEEDSRFAEDSETWPRYTLIEWEGENEPLPISMQGQDVIHRESLFFPSDLNSGFTSLTTSEDEATEQQTHLMSDNTSTASKLEYLLETVASNKYTENLEKNIHDQLLDTSAVNVLQPLSTSGICNARLGVTPCIMHSRISCDLRLP